MTEIHVPADKSAPTPNVMPGRRRRSRNGRRNTDGNAVLGPEHPMPGTEDRRQETTGDQQKQASDAVRASRRPQDRPEPSWSWSRTVPDHDQPYELDYGRYFDVAALLAGTLPEPPAPAYGTRDDARALFYAGEVNLIFGDPESGKTWLALAAAREVLGEHGTGRVLVIDLDHNGPEATVSRLLSLGAAQAALSDRERFLFVEPEDRSHLLSVVADMKVWTPTVVVLDSLGELLPLLGSSSNSADEYTDAHRAVLKPLAKVGAAVLVIDHLAKNTESRTLGPGGTAAKRRTIGGVSLRVTIHEAFAPGKGGSAWLGVNKDRHGGLRRHCPTARGEPSAGLFRLVPSSGDDRVLEPIIRAPRPEDKPPTTYGIHDGKTDAQIVADVAVLSDLDPPPTSKEDVKARMGWGSDRAYKALKAFREQGSTNSE